MTRSAIAVTLCAGTFLIAPISFAQTEQQAAESNCAALVAYVEAHQGPKLAVTLEEARSFTDETACKEVLAKATAAAEPATEPTGEASVEAGAVQVEQPARAAAAPTIIVDQPKPEVIVRQPTPEILVRQPAPVITIDIPQPQIIVRMPDPAVSVSQAEPQVQVEQPAEVVVRQDAEAEVQIGRAEQPVIRYESEEPLVRINRAEGEREIEFQSAPVEAARTTASVEVTGSVRAADAPEATARGVVVSSLAGLAVVNSVGEKVGTVERLLISEADERFHLVIVHGGFLGLGQAEALLPLDAVAIAENKLVIRDLSEDQIRQLPGWQNQDSYREVEGDAVAQITVAAR